MFTPPRIVHALVTLMMLATLAIAQNQPATQTSPNPGSRKTENFAAEMKRLRDTWVQEFNARNAKGVAALYAPDAVLMRWDGTVHGYDSILAEFERSATGNAHNYVVHPLHVEHSGELGYETGAYNVTLRDRVSEGNYLLVVKKIKGEWKIPRHRFQPENYSLESTIRE